MEAVLNDAPAENRSIQTRINKSNASQMGLLSGQRRRERREAVEQQRNNPAPSKAVSDELELVLEQITLTRAVLNDKNYHYCEHCERSGVEPHHRAQLLRALDGLLDRKRILEDRPLPGSRRPAPERKPRQSAGGMPEPTPM